jgi:hypothetical protein
MFVISERKILHCVNQYLLQLRGENRGAIELCVNLSEILKNSF